MSSDKLTLVTLSGPLRLVDTALQSCVINLEFHPENAVSFMRGAKMLSPLDISNPYDEPLQLAFRLAGELGIAPEYSDFSGDGYTEESTVAYFRSLSASLSSMQSEMEANARQAEMRSVGIEHLRHIHGVDEKLMDMLNMKYVKFRFGRIPESRFEDFMQLVEAREDVFYFQTGTEGGWVYGVFFALPSIADQLDSVCVSMGFERIRINDLSDVGSTADEAALTFEEERDRAISAVHELKDSIRSVREAERGRFLRRYSHIRFLRESFALRAFAGQRNGRFYIIGWVPSEDAEKYSRECESIEGFSCFLTSVNEMNRADPPVRMKKNFLTSIFHPFLKMYGLPTYGEIDPSFFMALTYSIIFGIMFGDVGQGAVLSIIGLLLWRKRGMWLGRVLACVGVFSVIFGFAYGSVFGYEHALPGFKVLEQETRMIGSMEVGNTMVILFAAVAIGVVLMLICMVMNIINGIRQGDLKKIFFSPNGVAGAVLYLSVAAGAASTAVFGKNPFSAPYILCLIVLPLLLIMAAEPLTKLLTGCKDWRPGSIGMFFVEGFFELFETVLSYVSNTVSFLRIGAFAISHAGMMMVVFMLTQTTNGGNNIFGVVIGNAIVMGIEATLVCIQVMRLEFYELFGRFYDGRGRSFAPCVIDYSKVPSGT